MKTAIIKAIVYVILFLLCRLLAQAGPVEHVLPIDDFEDGDLKSPNGASWIVLADDLMGGSSVARIEAITGEDGGSRGALRISGRRGSREPSFAGVWLALDASGRSLDLGGFEGLRLRVRGSGPLMAGFRTGFMNYMAEVEAGPQWRTVEIPFAKLSPVTRTGGPERFPTAAVGWIGVTTSHPVAGSLSAPAGGQTEHAGGSSAPADGRSAPTGALSAPPEFAFEIDDVELYGRAEPSAEPAPSGPAGSVETRAFTPASSIPSAGWVELAADPEGDASMGLLPDATRLEMVEVPKGGTVWFRIVLKDPPHGRWMGVNLALDVDGDPSNGAAWWGANKGFHFDRIVSVYCIPVQDGCQGVFGVVDAAQATAGTLWGGGAGLQFAIDAAHNAFVVGVPRADLRLGPGPNRLVGAVGSALFFGDDVPNSDAVLIK